MVRVWVASLDVGLATLRQLSACLSPAERARARRYRFQRDARSFSAARGWLRHVLAAELDVPAGDIRLSEGPGKPRVAGDGGPCFNLSHAGELCLIAVAPRPVGVDVEEVGSGPAALDVMRLACTATEVAALELLGPGLRPGALLRLWTAKEAYLKASGLGLAVPPDQVELGDEDPESLAPVRMVGDPVPTRWWVRHLRPAPGYVGAVAAEGRRWRATLHSTAELPLEQPAAAGVDRGGGVAVSGS